MTQRPASAVDRRSFLKSTTAAAVVGTLSVARSAHAAGSDTLKVGLIGCGGRGTGAAAQALGADPGAKLVAMGDTFADRVDHSLERIRLRQGEDAGEPYSLEQIAVDDDHKFTGFDAYKQVIDSGVDVVLLCEPPHFRPMHMEYAVAAGKHIFAEKPVAVDAPGVRRILAASAEAERKGLSVVSGLCWRYDEGKREVIKRIHDGEIGRVTSIDCSYNTNGLWMHPRQPEWSDMEWQIRNWLYFTWLSGDHNVEQHIHSLDKASWVLRDQMPVRAIGLGGRQTRTDPAYGHIFDHHAVMYEFADGTRVHSYCRQQDGCAKDVSDHIVGTEGRANLLPNDCIMSLDGQTKWRYRNREKRNMYDLEHEALFSSIRKGEPINNGQYMSNSTMMAIMGRMASYTGQIITWDQAINSTEDLTPAAYEWSSMPVAPVAMPGFTQFS